MNKRRKKKALKKYEARGWFPTTFGHREWNYIYFRFIHVPMSLWKRLEEDGPND